MNLTPGSDSPLEWSITTCCRRHRSDAAARTTNCIPATLLLSSSWGHPNQSDKHKILFCYIHQMLGSSLSKSFLAELGTPEARGKGTRSGHSGGCTSHCVQLSHGISTVPEHAVLMTLFLFLGWGGKGGGSANNLTISCTK